MTITALIVYLAWLVLAFGVRTAVHVRETGDSGFRGLSRSGPVETAAGVGFVVALVVGFAAPIAGLAGLSSIAALDSGPLGVAGVVAASVGVILTLLAQLSMGDSWRIGVDTDERTTLVADGMFGLVRNPIFTAMVTTALGLTLMVPNVLAIVGLAGLIAAIEVQVRLVEEPYLRSVHGKAYRRYEATVGRFVPGIGRTPGSRPVGDPAG